MSDTTVSHEVLAKVAGLDIFDVSGNAIKFGSLYEQQKAIVVFVRQFYCGSCQEYCMALTSVREEALLEANTRVVVIGCGEPDIIANYRAITGFTGPIYTNQSLSLYEAFGFASGLHRPPADKPKRDYIQSGYLAGVLKSIARFIQYPVRMYSWGPVKQLGGEFILGPGQTCSFAHKMEHSEDHTDVKELMQAARVAHP